MEFPVIHSVISPSALAAHLLPNYDIGAIRSCHLCRIGENDTYLVSSSTGRFILRVYRSQRPWRPQSLPEIEYEIDLVLHLHSKGIPVSVPIPRRDGKFINLVEAPEGRRYAVLFTFADGTVPKMDRRESYLYGQAVATLHEATHDFKSNGSRHHDRLDNLLKAPLARIHSILIDQPADWVYLDALGKQLEARILDLPVDKLESGVCHGDLFWQNVHVSDESQFVFFDFDNCGPSWRTYDLAMIVWAAARMGKGTETWKDFLEGYTAKRHLGATDLEALRLFGALWHIRFMASRSLFEWSLDRDIWLNFLKEWMNHDIVY